MGYKISKAHHLVTVYRKVCVTKRGPDKCYSKKMHVTRELQAKKNYATSPPDNYKPSKKK